MRITRRSLQNLPVDIDAKPLALTPPKKRGVILLACVGIYLVAYSVLSVRGGYIGHNQGGSDNRDTWFPAYCAEPYTSPAGRQKVQLTPLGSLFLAPMLIDQIAIHHTHFDVD
ncbi:MAG TPA: hypothetical protein VLT36_07970 [Candidatus Dormibacteraeota bacterium]|nr:hypothetical protein [Candidatus Dormibacteraeota bacterium]